MKQIYTCLIISLIVFGCKKETATVSGIQLSFSDSAILFLKTTLPGADFNRLDANSIQVLRLKNKDIGIKIFEKGMSHDKFIMLKKVADNFTGNRVIISGLKSKERNGFISLETLDRISGSKFIIENNKVTGVMATDTKSSGLISKPKIISNKAGAKTAAYELPEVIITVYRQSVEIDFMSLFWLFDQSGSYDSYYIPYDGGSGSGGGGGGGVSSSIVEAAPKIYSPDRPVSDVKNEVKCFTNNASSTYSITINVNQPKPGSRDVFDPLAAFPVGHTYLTLQQNNADGSFIIRNIGFYPKNVVKPGSTTDVSTFGEDSGTPFDVSLKISVSGADFSTVMTNLISQQYATYDLNTFNCTNSAINALGSINVHLPATNSASLLFSGNNPADLGEDIKGLNLDNFSAGNGGRKVVRSQSSDNTQKAAARAGGC